jgi:hypothetical protein
MRGSPDPFKRLSEDAILDFVKWLTSRTLERAAKWQVYALRNADLLSRDRAAHC